MLPRFLSWRWFRESRCAKRLSGYELCAVLIDLYCTYIHVWETEKHFCRLYIYIHYKSLLALNPKFQEAIYHCSFWMQHLNLDRKKYIYTYTLTTDGLNFIFWCLLPFSLGRVRQTFWRRPLGHRGSRPHDVGHLDSICFGRLIWLRSLMLMFLIDSVYVYISILKLEITCPCRQQG